MAALIAAAGCSQTPNKAATNEARPVASNTAAAKEGFPTAQPDGSPLTANYCSEVTDKPASPFDNTKTCLMIACDTGDKASCDLMETYNGSMWPDGEPPTAPIEQLTGKFEAISTTAMGITGGLTFTPGQFSFELDQSYRVGHPRLVDASSAMSRSGDTWADALIIPKTAKVALWPVIDQTIDKRARQQSLCGQGDKVGFIATADREDGIALAAFRGDKVPGAAMDDTALCGTYFFGRSG